VLRGDEWRTPVLGPLADAVPRGDVGQDAVLDRLLDLLLIHAVRACLARSASQAPGWFRAQDDPIVGHAIRLLQDNPAQTLGSVAVKVGYGSAYALSAAFKRVRGIRPGYYRHAEKLRAQSA
jgi:AraC-like DNA-binding protein